MWAIHTPIDHHLGRQNPPTLVAPRRGESPIVLGVATPAAGESSSFQSSCLGNLSCLLIKPNCPPLRPISLEDSPTHHSVR